MKRLLSVEVTAPAVIGLVATGLAALTFVDQNAVGYALLAVAGLWATVAGGRRLYLRFKPTSDVRQAPTAQSAYVETRPSQVISGRIATHGAGSPVVIAASGAVVTVQSGVAPVSVTSPSTSRLPESYSPHATYEDVTIELLDDPNTVGAAERAIGAEWCHFRVNNPTQLELTSCSVRALIDGVAHDLVWANRNQGPPLALVTLPQRSQSDVPFVMRGWDGHGYCPRLRLDRDECYVSGNQLLTQCSTLNAELAPGQYSVVLEVNYHVVGQGRQVRLDDVELVVPPNRRLAPIRIARP